MADWESAPLVGGGWESAPVVERRKAPRTASGLVESAQSGYQISAVGLIARGALPDLKLDPHHSKWYERAAATAGQILPDIVPFMIPGALVGGTVGAAG